MRGKVVAVLTLKGISTTMVLAIKRVTMRERMPMARPKVCFFCSSAKNTCCVDKSVRCVGEGDGEKINGGHDKQLAASTEHTARSTQHTAHAPFKMGREGQE